MAQTGADTAEIQTEHKGLLTVAIMAATLLQVLDTTIANVALPHMQASLGATQDTISWVLTSYIVASAIAIPITGWLADRYGARALFLVSVATFVIASMLCGIATSIEEMVLFRLCQGVAGAFIAPLAQTTMLDINRPSDRAKAMSIYGMGIMIGPICGPIIGGWLTDNFNWRWVFYVNVPVGAVCFAMLWFLMPHKRTLQRKFDLMGFGMLAICLCAFQLLLDRGEHVDWFNSTEIWIEAAVALSFLWIFVVHLLTAKEPIFPAPMMRDRNFLAGSAFMFVIGMVALSAMAILPSMMQNLYGYSVLGTGQLLSSRGIGLLFTMFLVGRISHLVDARLLILAGFMLTCTSLWMMTTWSLEMGWMPFVWSGLVQGLGMGLVFVPVSILTFATLPGQYRTDASSVANLTRNLGSSIGISVVTSQLAQNIQVSHEDMASNFTPDKLPIDPNLVQALGGSGDTILAMANAELNRQAAMIAYLDDFKLMLIACAATVPLLLLLRKPKAPAGGAKSQEVHVME